MEKILYTEIGPTGNQYKKGDWKEISTHSESEVKGFFGEFRFLSNFGKATVVLDGVKYNSVEIAYQAAKWKKEYRNFFNSCTELESIDYNRKNDPNGYIQEDWDSKKVEIMRDLLNQKFDKNINPENYKKLLATGDKYLEETNWWGDNFWGSSKDGGGENMLGKILMEIREELRS